MDKAIQLGRYFLAIPMIVFGAQHFIYLKFESGDMRRGTAGRRCSAEGRGILVEDLR